MEVVALFHSTNKYINLGEKEEFCQKREITPHKKIMSFEKAVRSHVCLVMRKRVLCSFNYILYFLFVYMFLNIFKFNPFPNKP